MAADANTVDLDRVGGDGAMHIPIYVEPGSSMFNRGYSANSTYTDQ